MSDIKRRLDEMKQDSYVQSLQPVRSKYACARCGKKGTADELDKHFCYVDAHELAMETIRERIAELEARLAALEGNGK